MKWPWQWFRHDSPGVSCGDESEAAVAEQRAKLSQARAQQPVVRRAVNDFTAEVEAALARRHPQ